MTEVADFIKDTLGLIGVTDPRQPVKAEDMALGIRFLNRLCGRMEANALSVGWTPVDSPSDTLPLPPEAELGVMYSLAVMLCPQFGQPVPAEVAAGASVFMEDLRRDQAVATPIQPILDAPWPQNWRYGYRRPVTEG